MRPIRFRGKTFIGEIVYGYYMPQCPMSSFPCIVDDQEFMQEVYPESIEQLIAVDKNHNDVYENDLIFQPSGFDDEGYYHEVIDACPYEASLSDYSDIISGNVVLYEGKFENETD